MNREENFLEPVIRYVRWGRAEDVRRALAGEITWPTATLALSHFHDARAEVDQLMREVQARVTAVPFSITGLVTDRRVLDATPDDRGEVEVYARNDVQRVKVATRAANDGGLHTAVVNGIATQGATSSPRFRRLVRELPRGSLGPGTRRDPSLGLPIAVRRSAGGLTCASANRARYGG
jgi:hypothetical protein